MVTVRKIKNRKKAEISIAGYYTVLNSENKEENDIKKIEIKEKTCLGILIFTQPQSDLALRPYVHHIGNL